MAVENGSAVSTGLFPIADRNPGLKLRGYIRSSRWDALDDRHVAVSTLGEDNLSPQLTILVQLAVGSGQSNV